MTTSQVSTPPAAWLPPWPRHRFVRVRRLMVIYLPQTGRATPAERHDNVATTAVLVTATRPRNKSTVEGQTSEPALS